MSEIMTKSQKMFDHYKKKIARIDPIEQRGVIQNIIGMIIES